MFMYAFERLETWNLSIDRTVRIYEHTDQFPPKEQYGLSQQVRRAAVSISSNLAEGSGRISKKDQAHFFNIAYSSLMEVLNQLIIANKIGYLEAERLASMRARIEMLSKKIAALRNHTLNYSLP